MGLELPMILHWRGWILIILPMIIAERGEDSKTDVSVLLNKTKGCDYECAPLQCIFICFFSDLFTPPIHFDRFLCKLQTPIKQNHSFLLLSKQVILLERGWFSWNMTYKHNDYSWEGVNINKQNGDYSWEGWKIRKCMLTPLKHNRLFMTEVQRLSTKTTVLLT